jgi:hypothetical protein
MAEMNPVTKIEGLFTGYKDEEVVDAKEYNGNTLALKGAIEHNGKVTEAHAEAIKTLSTGNIPANGVTSEQIADAAVTEEKLSPSIRNTMLLSAETMSAYFKDYLIQVHKHTPDIKGTFLNGSILDVNATFKTDLNYSKKVTLAITAVQDNENGAYGDEPVVTVKDNYFAPETYRLCPNLKGLGPICSYTGVWTTEYVFNEPITVTASDNYVFKQTAHTDAWLRGCNIVFDSISAISTNGAEVDFLEQFECLESNGYSSLSDWDWYQKTCIFKPNAAFTPLTNVKKIKVVHRVEVSCWWVNGGYASFDGYANYSYAQNDVYTEVLQTTQTSAKMTYQGVGNSSGKLTNAHFSFRIIDEKGATRNINFSDTPLEVGVYCTASFVEGTELHAFDTYYPQEDYINCTLAENSTYKATKVSDTEHFVEQTFSAPLCIVFDITDTVRFTKFGTLYAGTYKLCYDAYDAAKAYIYRNNYSACLENLYADCSDSSKITNVRSAFFEIGNSIVKYKASTPIMDVTLKDVCAIRY